MTNTFFPNSSGSSSSTVATNLLVNGAFDYWQAVEGGNSVTTAAGGSSPTPVYAYSADQWYINNILGGGTTEGQINFFRAAGALNGSIYQGQILITRSAAGTGSQNGCELWQVLSNKATQSLIGQTASFSINVQAQGNVNQIGLQFYYATSEAKPTVTIGSEATTSISSGSMTLCKINGQALGTSMTSAGVIGIRIRPTAVSSGNLWDVNNGFVVEQAMLNVGSTPATFSRQFNDPSQELAACQYFYEKSYDIGTAPGASTEVGMLVFPTSLAAGTNWRGAAYFKSTMRTDPAMSYWDAVGGSSKYSYYAANNTRTDAQTNSENWVNIGMSSAAFNGAPGISSSSIAVHWVADARI